MIQMDMARTNDDKINELAIQMENISTTLREWMNSVGGKIEDIRTDIKEIKELYVSKDRFSALEARVKGLERAIGWAVGIVVGGVIMAMLALIFKQ